MILKKISGSSRPTAGAIDGKVAKKYIVNVFTNKYNDV